MSRRNPSATLRRDQIYQFIIEYAVGHDGNSPSIREIADKCGIHASTTYIHLLKLGTERKVEYRDGKLCVIGAEFSPP